MDAYQQWRNWADPKVCCDYSFHMCVTYWNATVADQMQQVCSPVEEGGAGINSFKMFMVRILQRQHLIYIGVDTPNSTHMTIFTLVLYLGIQRRHDGYRC